MRDQNPPIPRGSRSREKLEQRIAETAIEVSHAIARAEDYGDHLVNQARVLFDADAGVGLAAWSANTPIVTDRLQVCVAGAPPVTPAQASRVSPLFEAHPGFLAMTKVGTTTSVRVSDHTDIVRFWSTEGYWQMHGPSNSRYPACALLHATNDTHLFLAIHRHDRDFSDSEVAGLADLQRPIAAALSFRAAMDDTVRLLQNSRHAKPDLSNSTHLATDIGVAGRLCVEYSPTRREGEVLTLAAQGWTNQQIGQRLGITERTVRKHLTAVYDKAGVRGRAAAAAWWQRRVLD